MTLDCGTCGKPQPAEFCWQGRWDCPCMPPRAMEPDLWRVLNELRRRIEKLERGPRYMDVVGNTFDDPPQADVYLDRYENRIIDNRSPREGETL